MLRRRPLGLGVEPSKSAGGPAPQACAPGVQAARPGQSHPPPVDLVAAVSSLMQLEGQCRLTFVFIAFVVAHFIWSLELSRARIEAKESASVPRHGKILRAHATMSNSRTLTILF